MSDWYCTKPSMWVGTVSYTQKGNLFGPKVWDTSIFHLSSGRLDIYDWPSLLIKGEHVFGPREWSFSLLPKTSVPVLCLPSDGLVYEIFYVFMEYFRIQRYLIRVSIIKCFYSCISTSNTYLLYWEPRNVCFCRRLSHTWNIRLNF